MRIICAGFSGGSGGKESACKVGDLASIPGSGRSPGEGTSNPLQNSCLENAMGRGAWQTMGGRVGRDWATTWCDVWQSVQKRTKDCLNKHIRSEFPISVQFSSVSQSYPTLCYPMDCSTPGIPVHHQLPEFTQAHVHWVGDAIQPSHPLSSPSPSAFNLSQHQSLFQWVNSSHEVAKVLEFQLQHQSFQWIFMTDFL